MDVALPNGDPKWCQSSGIPFESVAMLRLSAVDGLLGT